VPIWVDEVPFITAQSLPAAPQLTPSLWKDAFLGPDAREVRDVIGAVVVCLQRLEGPTLSLPDDGLLSSHSAARKRLEDTVQGLKELLQAVGEVKSQIEEERGGVGEVPGLVVLVGKEEKKQRDGDQNNSTPQSVEFGVEWWDGELVDMGMLEFEVVAWDPKAEEMKDRRNEFGGQFFSLFFPFPFYKIFLLFN
jgi:hypothetical protein